MTSPKLQNADLGEKQLAGPIPSLIPDPSPLLIGIYSD